MSVDPEKLHGLIGQKVTYQGIPCRIIEVLDEGPLLVLQDCLAGSVIQANQHGEASRRAPRVFTVKLFNVRRDSLNPAIAELRRLLS